MIKKIKRLSLFFGLSMIFLNGCEGWDLDDHRSGIKQQRPLIQVATVVGPLTYFKQSGLQSGLEHDILAHFGQEMNYRLVFRTYPTEKQALVAVQNGEAQILATRSPLSLQDTSNLLASPAYDEQNLILNCRQDIEVDKTLLGNLSPDSSLNVVASSKSLSNEQKIRFRQIYFKSALSEVDNGSTVDLLKLVQRGKANCALVDELEAKYYSRFFPKLSPALSVQQMSYHFFVNMESKQIHSSLRTWFKKAARQGNLVRYKHHYVGHLDELSLWDRFYFYRSKENRFDEYKKDFKKFARNFNLPWQLVAAVAFQESQWKPDAISYTGVKGLMQLTKPTAEHLGVLDRTDPQQSIWGGAKYLRYLFDKMPKHLPDRERWALTLAAYNIGFAHLLDAQELARREGKNPFLWSDLKTVLPKLEDQDIAADLKYGQARGNETVDFVKRVFAYYDLLTVPYL